MTKTLNAIDIDHLIARITECVGDADAAGLAVVAAHLETAILSIPRQPARAPIETAFPSYLLN